MNMPPNGFPNPAPPPAGELKGNLMTAFQQAQQRQYKYEQEIRFRGQGLAIMNQQAMNAAQHLAAQMQQGNQAAGNALQRLRMVMTAIHPLMDTSPELEALVRRERAIQTEVLRILNGLPPTMTVPQQPMTAQQGAAPQQQPQQQPVTPAQMASNPTTQGEALLQAMAAAQPMPTVQVQGGIPGAPVPRPGETNVVQFPNGQVPPMPGPQASRQFRAGGPQVIHVPVVQTPNAPANNAAPATGCSSNERGPPRQPADLVTLRAV